MAAQGNDSADEVKAEARSQDGGEPLTAAVNRPPLAVGRRGGARLACFRPAQQASAAVAGGAGTPRAAAVPAPRGLRHRRAERRPQPAVADGEGTDDSEDCEEPRSAAAMLNIFRSIPTEMDYKGQKLAEQIFQGIILVSAIIGFICGYITEQFGWTVYIVLAGFVLSCLLTLPPWPIYRRNPLQWLPVQESGAEEKKSADRKPKRHAKN